MVDFMRMDILQERKCGQPSLLPQLLYLKNKVT